MACRFGFSALLASILVVPAQAGVFTNKFNTDPGAAVALTGVAKWVDAGGVGGSGYVSITDAVGSQQGGMIIPEIDPGKAIGGFRADFQIRIGGGSARPADGISFVFAPEVDDSSNFGEEGLGTGLVLSFDTWDNNGTDTAPAIDVKVGGTGDGNIVATTYLGGVREGNRARPGAIFKDAAGAEVQLETGDQFVPVTIEVKGGVLNVFYKNLQLVKDVVVAFAAVPGRFAFGGRTGGAWDNQWIDDLRIETFPLTAPAVVGFSGNPKGFTLRVQDAPSSAVDASTVKVTLDGAAATVTATKVGDTTTISFTNPTLFTAGSAHPLIVTYSAGTPAVTITNTLTLNVPNFTLITSAAALPAASIDTTKKGFSWRVHQIDGAAAANSLVRTETQLAGGLGDNMADPAAAGIASGPAAAASPTTAPLSFIIPGVVNLDQTGGSANGNFTPDDQMPGIPGTTGGADSIAAEILTALEFPAAGSYTMIVNSDDGFRTSAGLKNPRDAFTPTLGLFDGGRGAADTSFQIYVEAPGLYAFRTIWEEGGGGANIELLTQLADGTKVLINDAASAQSIKAFQIPAAALPAYVKSVSPGVGVTMINRPKTIEVVIADAGTTVNTTGIALKLNGTAAAVTANKVAGETKVVHTVVGDLLPNTEYSAELTYSDTTGPRTVSWKFKTGTLSSTLFAIESEDFDYDGGKTNPQKGVAGKDVDIMPYLGNAYDTLSAIEHIDFVNADGPDSDFYRTELGDDGDHEVNITSSLGLNGGNGIGGTISINSADRGGWTMTANYRIGWVGNGEWQNYSRTFPTNSSGGWWKVFAALSYDGSADGQLSGTLDRVTAGWGTVDQTVARLGQFSAPGSGGWGSDNLVPMKTATGADAVVKLAGTNTVRFNLSSGDFDFLLFSQAAAPPPSIVTAPGGGVDSSKRDAVVLDWTIADSDAKVVASSVKVLLAGADMTSKAVIGQTNGVTSVHVDLTGTTQASGEQAWRIVFSDNSTPPQTVTTDGIYLVNPYPTPGVFVIEAEDFNYSDTPTTGGGKANPQKGTAGLDVDVMPYNGGAYDQLSAVEGVDYNNNDGEDSLAYRTEADDTGGNEVNITASNGSRYSNDRGVFDLANNYRIGWVEAGSWQNYTRTFPTNSYNVWAALSFDGRSAGQLNGSLDMVGGDVTKSGQTTSRMGTFSFNGSGGWGRNELVPMKGTNGAMATVSMGGKQTVRFNLGSGDFDYLLFVPATVTPAGPKFTSAKRNSDGSITLEWTGGGVLEAAASVTGPWIPVTGATSPYKFTPAAGQPILFGRIRQ